MPLNPPSGNMYPFAWTWNPLAGPCKHNCSYCYVHKKIAPKLLKFGNGKYYADIQLIESELNTPLRKPDDGKLVFVQSCGDHLGEWIPTEWIIRIYEHCQDLYFRSACKQKFLLQTKNPSRFFAKDLWGKFPDNSIFGTTLETNRSKWYQKNHFSCAPSINERFHWMKKFHPLFEKMVSIEPALDFDVDSFVEMIQSIDPVFVSIGADSCNCGLPEPSPEKVSLLISKLEGFTEVRVKDNLKRLLEGELVA